MNEKPKVGGGTKADVSNESVVETESMVVESIELIKCALDSSLSPAQRLYLQHALQCLKNYTDHTKKYHSIRGKN